jgi:hypothetical protein
MKCLKEKRERERMGGKRRSRKRKGKARGCNLTVPGLKLEP